MRLPDPRALRRRTSRAPARPRPTTRQAEGHLRLDYRPAIDGLRAIAVIAVVVAALAAALPLDLVLPKHIKVPAELREKL